ncbi:MAG: hypothetical protein Q9226_005900 [Calogaya cf. arnoldii]
MSRPDQIDYTLYGMIAAFILVLAAHATIPTLVRPSMNRDLPTRLLWLTMLIIGCTILALVPLFLFLDNGRAPERWADKMNLDFLDRVAVIVLVELPLILLSGWVIHMGLRLFYRDHPTWFPYLMEVEPNYLKDTTSDMDAEKGYTAIDIIAEKGYATFDLDAEKGRKNKI